MTESSSEFDWANAQEHDCIVQQQVHRVAIYNNPHGDVVIRQERDWNEEDDPFIVIARAHAVRAAHAILDAAGLGDIEFVRPCNGGSEDGPIRAEVAALAASRPDIDWHAVNRDFNAVEAEVTEPQHRSLKERRELAAEALRQDPTRSNRAIGAECGVSDKTVGAVRAEIGAEIRNDAAEIRTKEKQLRLITAE
jgi:hypothetical protein